jgi:hypothetical protein
MDIKTIIESGDAATPATAARLGAELANAAIPWGRAGELLSRPLITSATSSSSALSMTQRCAWPGRHRCGGDIDDRNGDPLNAAASPAPPESGLLLDAGARTDRRGLFGATALHWAAYIGNVVLVRRLLEKGAPTASRTTSINRHRWAGPWSDGATRATGRSQA